MEIIDKLDVSDKTKEGYKNLFKILERDQYDFNSNVKKTETYLSNYPIRKQMDLLNVIIVIRKYLNKDIEQFRNLRDKLKPLLQNEVHNKLSALDVMSVSKFKTSMNNLYKNDMYLEYILNYLCFHYGVRNTDLDLSIGIEADNYLMKDKDKIIYYRRNYKTHDTYGDKHHTIKDKKFIDSYNKLQNGPIFDGLQITNFLKNKLIMPENLIFKMLIKHYEEKGNSKKIKQLATDRGTSIPTVLTNYNINNNKYVIQ
jgi:hypothetical protein